MTPKKDNPMPKDVLPPTEEERLERADKLISDLKAVMSHSGQESLVAGQILHDLVRQDLWRMFADTMEEFANSVGMSKTMAFMRRKNYEVFILEHGLAMDDERLLKANESKLALGTRDKYRPWVAEHLDGFLDLATKELGEGGLTRADLIRHMEDELGISDEDEDSQVQNVLKHLRRAVFLHNELADESWQTLMQAIRNDEETFRVLAHIVEQAGKRQVLTPRQAPEGEEEVEVDLNGG